MDVLVTASVLVAANALGNDSLAGNALATGFSAANEVEIDSSQEETAAWIDFETGIEGVTHCGAETADATGSLVAIGAANNFVVEIDLGCVVVAVKVPA